MSTKFEQLLDYLVNEDHEKASELFHEIVVEKSREIYENIIAQEGDEEDEEMDEALEEDDEEMDEAFGDQEDSYEMDDEEEPKYGGDASDKSLDDVEMDQDGEEGAESQEDQAIFDIKNAIEELEAAFAELEAAQDSEKSDMGMDRDDDMDMNRHDMDRDSDDGEDTDEEMIGMPMENRRMTREYVEKVGNDWDKNSQKTQGAIAGANTGEKMPTANDHRSPVASANNKPMPNINSKNIAQGGTGEGNNTGTKPNSVNKGITPEKSGNYTGNDWAANSAPGAHAKGYTQKADRMPMKQAPEGQPIGAGTGDNSVSGATNTSSVVAEGRRRTTSKRK